MSTGYNIVILPSVEITTQCIEWSQDISRQTTTKFILDGKTYHPHLTLYQSSFPEDHMSDILSVLHQTTKKLWSFEISFNLIDVYGDYVFYFAEKTPPLQSIHEQLVSVLNPIRDPMFSLPDDLKDAFPSFFAKNIQTYGTALAMNDYLPHITLTRCLSIESAKNSSTTITSKKMTMHVNDIYLTNADHDGTCTKIIERISL